MRILFAAPDRDLLECYKKLLEIDFGETVTAFDGTQVISLLATEDFDIVILDRNIPRIDYEELIERIRDKEIPVIALNDCPVSAHDLTKPPLPNLWLSYPFTPEKICDEIKDTLNCVSSDEQFSVGDVEINVPGYRITGGPSLTAGEINVLRALLNGESITANDGVYINALNTKFGKIGAETRIKYKAKKGFELVAQNE